MPFPIIVSLYPVDIKQSRVYNNDKNVACMTPAKVCLPTTGKGLRTYTELLPHLTEILGPFTHCYQDPAVLALTSRAVWG